MGKIKTDYELELELVCSVNNHVHVYLSCISLKAYKDGVYRILGRTSVDIIKSGGYKIR